MEGYSPFDIKILDEIINEEAPAWQKQKRGRGGKKIIVPLKFVFVDWMLRQYNAKNPNKKVIYSSDNLEKIYKMAKELGFRCNDEGIKKQIAQIREKK